MNAFTVMLLRRALSPSVRKEEDGCLVLYYASFKLLPQELRPLLGLVEEMIALHPGVTGAKADLNTGTVTISWDPSRTDVRAVRAWMDRLHGACVDYIRDLPAGRLPSEEEIRADMTARMLS